MSITQGVLVQSSEPEAHIKVLFSFLPALASLPFFASFRHPCATNLILSKLFSIIHFSFNHLRTINICAYFQDHSLMEWSYKKAITIQVYSAYDPIPVPLNLLSNCITLLWCLGNCLRSNISPTNKQRVSKSGLL